MSAVDIFAVGGTAVITTVFVLFLAAYNFLRVNKSKVMAKTLNMFFLNRQWKCSMTVWPLLPCGLLLLRNCAFAT